MSSSAEPLSAPSPAPASLDAETVEKGASLGRDAWLRLRQNRLAMICLWVFIGITVLC